MFTLILSAQCFATDLGTPLKPKIGLNGKPALGFIYTTENDPDGVSMLFTFSSDLIPADVAAKKFTVNYYYSKSDSFGVDWPLAKSVHLSSLQIREIDNKIVNDLVSDLANDSSQVFLVFSQDSGKSVSFHLSLASLCKEYPGVFKNITEGTVGCQELH